MPFSMSGLETVTMRAPRMTKVPGGAISEGAGPTVSCARVCGRRAQEEDEAATE